MTSIIKADNISTVSGSGNITIPTGVKVVGTDAASIYAPGMVVQMVHLADTTVTRAATSSTSYVATNLSNSITPKFSNSKFIVRVATTGNNNTNAANQLVYQIFRKIGSGSFTNIRTMSGNDWGIGQVYSAASRIQVPLIGEIVDQPNTSETVEYKVYIRTHNGITIELPATTTEHCEMIIMEIAQ